MSKRKHTTEQRGSIFGKFYSPYMSSNYVSAEDCYQAYKQDLDRMVEIDGHIFTRIISHCRFYGYGDFSFHIIWQPHTEIHLHDTLVDEYGREFKIRTFEMLRFSGGGNPGMVPQRDPHGHHWRSRRNRWLSYKKAGE